MANHLDIPIWLVSILVLVIAGGPIAMGRYIFKREKGLLMTKEEHLVNCDKAKKEMRDGIKEEFADFREYFKREVEFKVLESLKNLNGTLEEKIESSVAKQIFPLKEEINRKLDLIEVMKALVKEKKKDGD